jgi:signal transduction histidine kinase
MTSGARRNVSAGEPAQAGRDAEARPKQSLVEMLVHDIRNTVSGIRMTAQLMLRHHEELQQRGARSDLLFHSPEIRDEACRILNATTYDFHVSDSRGRTPRD